MKVYSSLHVGRILVALCILGLVCLPVPASAQAKGQGSGERAKALICGKGTTVLVLQEHGFKNLDSNRIAVAYNPMIYDTDGTALKLKDLKIPCEAYVEYKWNKDNEPQLFRLEVQGYDEDATTLFTEKKKPEKLPE